MTGAIPSNPLLTLAGELLAGALNRALALDPAAAERLLALEGRSVEYTWTTVGRGLRVSIRDGRVAIGPPAADPDLAVSSSLAGLLGFVWPAAGAALGTSGARVDVSGDAELARRLGQLAQRFEPDLARALPPALGPIDGPALGALLGRLLAGLREGAVRFGEDAATFVREESRDAVAAEELDDFGADVDRLRDDVERLAVRVRRLTERGA
jgi:ubiquinone biosynthesis protein UbiJ